MSNLKTWTTVDKSDYPERGLWDDEPDKAHWIDDDTGLDCLVHRGPMGAFCGYVGVPESSEHFEKHNDDVSVDVHGGLTFAGLCAEGDTPETGICHADEDAANKKVWWLGFDCAHSSDYVPGMKMFNDNVSRYTTFESIQAQVTKLAHQLG